jgi:hypothetical protein
MNAANDAKNGATKGMIEGGIPLDRSRLLGFDQLSADDLNATQLAKVGDKTRYQRSFGNRLGGKIGGKFGIKQMDRTR